MAVFSLLYITEQSVEQTAELDGNMGTKFSLIGVPYLIKVPHIIAIFSLTVPNTSIPLKHLLTALVPSPFNAYKGEEMVI